MSESYWTASGAFVEINWRIACQPIERLKI